MKEDINNSRSVQWSFSGCILLILSIILYSLFLHIGMIWLGTKTRGAQIYVDPPKNIFQDQTFTLTMTIKNIGEDEFNLKSINVDSDFHKRFNIELIYPPYLEVYEQNAFGNNPMFQTYNFAVHISPGKSVNISFMGKSGNPKKVNGEIKVCINSNFICTSEFIEIKVKADIEN